ncbi:uncharacterized protein LOC129218897 [Uloborus diversus]|uniref:uncharacterized protein LOC129218897 n=1 Tax=Uloborus diversus TaxID=327109 RepID=UPI0024094FCE|nr:uncharacterized protein LOC129218897 [Uloborus diversus]
MDKTSVIVLTGNNWNLWKFKMKIILESKGLFEAINGEFPVEVDTEDENEYLEKLAEFRKKDLKAQEIIVSRVEEGPMAHIITCENANAMWNKLCSVYEHKSEVSIYMLQKKFFNYSHDGKDLSLYISGLEEIITKLKQYEENISDHMFMTKVLMGLPQEYQHFISAWESVPVENQSINELVSRLSIEEERMKNMSRKTETALI